jgi:diguanylate cyclase (GGDEF)-like protein
MDFAASTDENVPDRSQASQVGGFHAVASALLSSRGRVVTVDPDMVEMLGGTPVGWDSFPPEVGHLAMGLAGAETASAERTVAALRPGVALLWTVTSLAERGWLVQTEEMTDPRMFQWAIQLRDDRLETLSALHRLMEQVDFDVGLDAAVHLVAERTRNLLSADLVAIGTIDIDRAQVVFSVIAGRTDLAGIEVPIASSINGIAVTTGETQVSLDSELDDRVDKRATRAVGARSLVAVPLRHGGQIVGVLDVLSARPAAFSGIDVRTVELIGGAISAAYGHAADLATKRSLLAELHTKVAALSQSEAKLRHLAQHDALTGLPNRTRFLDRLEQALSRPDPPAVLYIDVDNFKAINDSFGHDTGDRLLREIAARLLACLPAHDLASRFGGDEFAVLCEGINDPLDLAARAQSIIRAFARHVGVDGEDVRPTLSIGGAIASGPGATPEAVLKDADTALFEAKRQGRACYRIHQPA